MRGTRVARLGLALLAGVATSACWNRIEVHPAPVAAEADAGAGVQTRVLGWSEVEGPEQAPARTPADLVARVEDGERTFHVIVGEDASGRPWSAAFHLDE